MAKEDNTQLTSIKLLENIYKPFKIYCIQSGTSLQKVVNRALYKYVTDEEFRKELDSIEDLEEASGSSY